MRAEMRRSPNPTTDVSKELRDIIAFAHPDKWPDASDLAHGVTRRLNGLRDRVKGGR